jgi:iron complex transport system substrate-binding protein
LTGRTSEGADFADYCNMTLGVITNRIAFVTREQRPRVYYARGPRGLVTGLGGAVEVELIELLARNVAGAEQGGLADVTLDRIRQWEPDAIVASDPQFMTSLRENSAWASLTAVRDGRIHLAPRLPSGWIDSPPSANRLIGLWWLAKSLYPEHFKEDLRELTLDFYTKFYHATPTAAQIARVLAASE